MGRSIVLTMVLMCIFTAPATASGKIYYVDADASGSADGLSWTNAFPTLQDALQVASSGDQIWVAQGVYYPDQGGGQTDNNRSASFQIGSGMALYGGFDPGAGIDLFGERNGEQYVTVLSGDIEQNDMTNINGVVDDTNGISGNNSYHVLLLDGTVDTGTAITSSTLLDGFVITAGQANGASLFDNRGGGLYCNGIDNGSCSPKLSNLRFSGNMSAGNGGALYNDGRFGGDSSPVLMNIIFSGNSASFGGAVYNYGGDGSSSPSFINVIFSGNAASGFGGAMLNQGESNGSSSPILINVTFSGNAASAGGAIYNYGDGGESGITLTNAILWKNSAPSGASIFNRNSSTTLSYSIVENGVNSIGSTGTSFTTYDANSNSEGDPLFVQPVDPANAPTRHGDLHLRQNSPAINNGQNSAVLTLATTDLDGMPRIISDTVDIGAYEFAGAQAAYDYGDAPDPTFPTLRANNGARHRIAGNLRLGAAIDAEAYGLPNGDATGDDANGDDEDGVNFPAELFACADTTMTVTPSASGVLNGWLDFNGDGDWLDLNEQIVRSLAVSAGAQLIPLAIPCDVLLNTPAIARFRLSSVATLGYSGDAPDGEVEDYTLRFSYGPPLAVDDYTSLGEDGSILIDVLRNDSDPQESVIRITAVSTPIHGTATVEGKAIRYTPGPQFYGFDRFQYTIANNNNKTAQATVQLGVRSVNDAPTGVLLSNKTLNVTDFVDAETSNTQRVTIPAGTKVGELETVDPDANDGHTYSLRGPDADQFMLRGNTIFTTKPIVVDLRSETFVNSAAPSTGEELLSTPLTITIGSSDNAGGKTESAQTILVQPPSKKFPAYVVAGTNHPIFTSIAENQPPETEIGKLQAVYGSGFRGSTLFDQVPPYSFQLIPGDGGEDNSLFSIKAGSLFANATFDYETKNNYSILVRVTDGNNDVHDKRMSIAVRDYAEPSQSPAKCQESGFSLIETSPTSITFTDVKAEAHSRRGCNFTAKLNLRLHQQNFSFTVSGKVDEKGQVKLDKRTDAFTLNVGGIALSSRGEIEYYDGNPFLRLDAPQFCMPQEWGGYCDTLYQDLRIEQSGLRSGSSLKLWLPGIKVGKGFSISGISVELNPVGEGYEWTGAGELGLPKFQSLGKAECGISASLTIYVDAQGATVMKIDAAAVASPGGFALREVSVGMRCDSGIPIDETGLELTGVKGTFSLRPGNQFVELEITVETTGQVAGVHLVTIEGAAKVLWDPEWGVDLGGAIKLLSIIEIARAETKIRDNRFSFSGTIRYSIVEGGLAFNAWTKHNSFAFTGSGVVTLGLDKGALFSGAEKTCRTVTGTVCNILTSWIPFVGKYLNKACHAVTEFVCSAIGIAIPPIDMRVASVHADFGKFTNGDYGVKGYFKLENILGTLGRSVMDTFNLPTSVGAYVGYKGNFKIGGVSEYQLVTPPQFAAAMERYQTSQAVHASGGDISSVSNEAIAVVSQNQLSIDTPLNLLNTSGVSAASIISQVRVSEVSTVTFILASDIVPALSLIAPNNITITQSNYNQPPISNQYTVKYSQSTVYSPQAFADAADPNAPRLRFVNFSAQPSLASVDVLVDGVIVWSNVTPLGSAVQNNDAAADYVELEPGHHTLSIAPSGQSNGILSTTIHAISGRGYTLYASGADTPKLTVLDDKDSVPPSFGQMYTRFVNVGNPNRKIDILINGLPFVNDLAYGQASAYQLIPKGNVRLEVKDASSGQDLAPASQYSPEGTLVTTVFLFDKKAGAYPMRYMGLIDDIYLPQVYTIYSVGGANTGNWKVDVTGDLSNATLALAVIGIAEPPSLDKVTVDAANLSKTKVNWAVKSDYVPTTVRLYGNPGEINSTVTYTDTNNQPVTTTVLNYAGYLLKEIKVTDPVKLKGTLDSLTADLTQLESGIYRLWVEVDDGVSPARSAYANKVGSNQVAVITVNNSSSFPLTWAPTITTVLDSPNHELVTIWTALAHPDVDSYTLYLGTTPGAPTREVTDISAFVNRDDQGNPVGTELAAGAFDNIAPGVYYLSIEAVDEESNRRIRTSEVKVTIGAGKYALTTPKERYTIKAGTTITIPVSLNVTQSLYDANVPLTFSDFGLPPGIFIRFANDVLGNTFLQDNSGNIAFSVTGAQTTGLHTTATREAVGETTVDLIIAVDSLTDGGEYPFTLVGRNGSSEENRTVTLVIDGIPPDSGKIFLPIIVR